MKRDVFIGGAWPYANYFLHIGHLAALLPGDVLARYYRLNGDNVIYVSGSDCHGTPITERAKKENVTPDKISEFYHDEFVKTFNNMGFSYDEYSKTNSENHIKLVQEYFLKLIANNYLYEKELPEDYCETCNSYLSDRQIIGICPHCGGNSTGDQCESCLSSLNSAEVKNKKCLNCGNLTTKKLNKHFYFKLPEFTNQLQLLIDNNLNTWRKNALGEAQKYINMGLIDRAATRQIDWGIKVPVAGYEDKRIYVWIEAVLGYLSAGYFAANKLNVDFKKFLDNDNKNLITYYVHGKDNIPFHTTIYPALLLGLDLNYRLPDYIISSAYVNLNNEKMSKSTGNLITVNELLEKFARDTLRFYFMFNGPETKDINCSIAEIIQDHNKFLVGVLGNFVNRNLSFIYKKFAGKIEVGSIDQNIANITKEKYVEVGKYIEAGEFKNALNSIFEYISLGNKYYDEKEPWNLVKNDIKAFWDTTYTCVYMMANIANLISPFMNDTSLKIFKVLKLNNLKWQEIVISDEIILDDVPPLLFSRMD